jgi:hypothetical protein
VTQRRKGDSPCQLKPRVTVTRRRPMQPVAAPNQQVGQRMPRRSLHIAERLGEVHTFRRR